MARTSRSALKIVDGRPALSEAQVLDAILDLLRRRGVPHARVNNTGAIIRREGKTFFGRRKWDQPGVADILAAWKSWPLAIEVKNSGGGSLSDAQQAWLLNWQVKGGGLWLVASTVEQVERMLEAL